MTYKTKSYVVLEIFEIYESDFSKEPNILRV